MQRPLVAAPERSLEKKQGVAAADDPVAQNLLVVAHARSAPFPDPVMDAAAAHVAAIDLHAAAVAATAVAAAAVVAADVVADTAAAAAAAAVVVDAVAAAAVVLPAAAFAPQHA